jgi:hypothetical protein
MSVITGVFETMPREEYDRLGFLNFSRLKYLERSPMAFRYHWDNPCPPTKPMVLGNHAHRGILEPHLNDFAVWPGPGIRRGKLYDSWCSENAGRTLLNEDEMLQVVGMTKAVHDNPAARKYLRYAKTEVSIVWRDPTLRRDFKARIDGIVDIEDEPVLVSLKTTTDCREFKFGAQYFKMCYHAQDAIYQAGYFYLTGTLPRMVTIAVESKPPHETAVYTIPNDVLRQGQQDTYRWIERLTECEKKNTWPAAVEGEQELQLPSYVYPGDFEFEDLEPLER